MPNRKLYLFAAFTVIITIVCWWFIHQRYQASAVWKAQEQALVFPEFQNKLNDITNIEVTRANRKFTISKQNNIWINNDLGGFPAIQTRVENAIIAIASLKYKEAKTKRTALYKQLDVEDVSTTAKSTRLVFKEISGNIVADIIIGKNKKNLNRKGFYIRLSNTKQAWLVDIANNDISLDVRYDSLDWSDRKVLNIAPSELKEITIGDVPGDSLNLYRTLEKSTQLSVKNLPPASKVKHQSKIDYASSLLKELSFIDIKPDLSKQNTTSPSYAVEAVTEYGTIITLKIYEVLESGAVWTKLEAKLVDEANPSKKATLEVARITSLYKDWLIKFPRTFTDKLKVKLSDILN